LSPKLAVSLALITGVVLGAFVLKPTTSDRNLLRFDPEVLDLSADQYVSGESIERTVHLRNVSSRPVRVLALPRNCGCMSFLEGTGDTFPVSISPGKVIPIKVRIATNGRVGSQQFAVQAIYESEKGVKQPPVAVEIRASIISGLHVIPAEIHLESEPGQDGPLFARVILADQWPGRGLPIKEIRTTADSRFKWELKPTTGPVIIEGLDLERRFVLELSYVPVATAKEFDEVVTVVPDNPKAKSIRLPFRGRKKAAYEFRPESLTIYGSNDGGPAERTIEYRAYQREYEDAKVESVPGGVVVSELPQSGGVKWFRLRIEPSVIIPTGALDLSFRLRANGPTVRFPIKYVR
jgi:hypothetical protein